MKLMLVIMTSDMPKEIWDYVMANGLYQSDGFTPYIVGYYVNEFNTAADIDKKNYTGIEEAKALDNFFVSKGAAVGEKILIEHG